MSIALKMPRTIKTLTGLSLLLSLALLCRPLAATQKALLTAENKPDTDAADVQALNSGPAVTLNADLQLRAGIQTQRLSRTHYQAEFQAAAKVVDLQPLLDLRERYLAALAEHQGATAALNFAEQAVKRTEILYRNGVNSQRQLQSLQMQLSAGQARVSSSRYRLQSLNDSLLANWGNPLSTWAKTANGAQIQAFINNRQALLLLTLPANRRLPDQVNQIAIDPSGDRQMSQRARLISKAPKGSQISQGETYFFQMPSTNLRTDMRLSAWIVEPDASRTGFMIPSSALIWHAGQAGVFLKTAPGQFSRRIVNRYFPIPQGYFIEDAMPNLVEVVTTGAQLLLSQEFRAIIPTEDEGDD